MGKGGSRMLAYKGLNPDGVASLGSGWKRLVPGVKYTEAASKTARSGWHCTENPFACLSYFPLGHGNHYYQVEAAGSIDEDSREEIACTELTLLRELTLKELAGYGMVYMVEHPDRGGWEKTGPHLQVAADRAQASGAGGIAIARGAHPVVRGAQGSILGLILEPEPGKVTAARLFVPEGKQAGRWYTLSRDRELVPWDGGIG